MSGDRNTITLLEIDKCENTIKYKYSSGGV